jgi:predicted O-methyltransferase YrrM
MDDQPPADCPRPLDGILADTRARGFNMASEPKTGALLRALASSKPGGRFLELGTGTGVGTAWMLSGMHSDARLDSVDNDVTILSIAQTHLAHDDRVTFHLSDGGEFLNGLGPETYDLIYADAWPGKFSHLDTALMSLRLGGIYLIDDLLPQPNWPEGHGDKVARLIEDLEDRQGFTVVKLAWASGLMMLVRAY